MLQGFIAQKPRDQFARYALALEFKNADRAEEALTLFTDLMTNDPDYTATYLHAGNLLVAMGRKDQARTTYEAGIAAASRRGDAHARGELEGALGSLG
jgi:tetratricopeptide (TPR) repeat protein